MKCEMLCARLESGRSSPQEIKILNQSNNKIGSPMEQESEKVTKKEIIDYLRNLQKATEVRARLSGINIWVLWGAFGLVVWTAMGNFVSNDIRDTAGIAVHLCEISVVLYYVFFLGSSNEDSAEVRFTPSSVASDSNLQKVWMLYFLWLGLPFLLDGIFYRLTFSNVFFVGVGTVGLCFQLSHWIMRKPDGESPNTLPPSPIVKKLLGIFLFVTSITLVVQAGADVGKSFPFLNLERARFVLLIAVGYWLIYLLLERTLQGNGDKWTYTLEKKLLLGSISAEDALASIEHRSFGARLSTVIERHQRNLSFLEQTVETSLEEMNAKVEIIRVISTDYAHERTKRLSEAAAPVHEAIKKIEAASRDFEQYSNKLLLSQNIIGDPRTRQVLNNLIAQNSERRRRVDGLSRNLNSLESRIMS